MALNAIVSWSTMYIEAAVTQLRTEVHDVRNEVAARISPLKHRHLNPLGPYSFTAGVPAADVLRPLRDPDAPVLDEDDAGKVATSPRRDGRGRHLARASLLSPGGDRNRAELLA
nr:Tn3 family transposase [Streptomyces sp. ICBB 8177]